MISKEKMTLDNGSFINIERYAQLHNAFQITLKLKALVLGK